MNKAKERLEHASRQMKTKHIKTYGMKQKQQ